MSKIVYFVLTGYSHLSIMYVDNFSIIYIINNIIKLIAKTRFVKAEKGIGNLL
jgi:hypothetical protein